MTRARVSAYVAGCGLTLALAIPAHAQVSGGNLMIGQAGNVIGAERQDRSDLYDRLDLQWSSSALTLGGRFEYDRSDDDRPDFGRLAAYQQVTQRWAEWERDGLGARVGNFYAILGRGLLHRSFELPGVVYDESGTQSRYAAARDLDGARLHAERGPIFAQLFRGRVNDGTTSPALEDLGFERYRGVLDGAELRTRLPRGASIGAAWTRYAYGDAPERQYASGFAAVDPLQAVGVNDWSLPLSFEYAAERPSLTDWWEFRRGKERPHAMYASGNLLWRRYSVLAEYKDYDGMRLGFNDPPSLVREHAAPLLNRDTHLLDAAGEEGFQLEASGPLHDWVSFTTNFSRSDGAPGVRRLRFEERYGELHVAPPGRDAWECTVFADRGFDTFDFVIDRHTLGLAAMARLPRALSVAIDLERKRVTTQGFFGRPEWFQDEYVSLTVSRLGWGSAGIGVTRTTDPRDLPSDDFGLPTADRAVFAGASLSGDVGESHQVSLFAGRRRGGRACTSGTCYDVPSLEGAELRVTSRF